MWSLSIVYMKSHYPQIFLCWLHSTLLLLCSFEVVINNMTTHYLLSATFIVNSAPKWKTLSTAISIHRILTCFGILGSWQKLLPTLQPSTSTTPWWAKSWMIVQPTATALCAMYSWMFVWTTEILRGMFHPSCGSDCRTIVSAVGFKSRVQ